MDREQAYDYIEAYHGKHFTELIRALEKDGYEDDMEICYNVSTYDNYIAITYKQFWHLIAVLDNHGIINKNNIEED